jgi:hypothetical protein
MAPIVTSSLEISCALAPATATAPMQAATDSVREIFFIPGSLALLPFLQPPSVKQTSCQMMKALQAKKIFLPAARARNQCPRQRHARRPMSRPQPRP